MALSIATNTGALMAAASATSVNKDLETSMERLSTGKRINSASDDAAGVAIATRLTSEIRGTNQAIRNAQDGQALIDTAEGAHKEVVNILQRMRELAVQSSNDTNDTSDRVNLQAEFTALATEIDRIAGATTWAGQDLLSGAGGTDGDGAFNLQVGGNTGTVDTITVTIGAMTTSALGDGTSVSGVIGTTGEAAVAAVSAVSSSAAVAVGDGIAATSASGSSTTMTGVITGTETNVLTLTAGTGTRVAGTYTFDIDGDTISVSVGSADTASTIATLIGTTVNGNSGNVTASVNGDAVTFTATAAVAAVAAVSSSSATSAVAQLTTVDMTDYTVEEDKTYKLTVGTVELSYTAADGDDYDSILAGLQADADYTSAGFTVAQTSGTLTITHTAGAISDAAGTVTFDDGLFDISSRDNSTAAIDLMDAAIALVNTQRAELGATSNRLDNTVNNLTSISIQLEGGRGRIEDADFAAESTSLAKSQILQQASTAMLAQANASKQNVLSLLQG